MLAYGAFPEEIGTALVRLSPNWERGDLSVARLASLLLNCSNDL
jgi:hypothetical protein